MNFFDELLVFAGGFFLLFLGDFLFLLGAEIDVALGDGFEALFRVLAKTGQDELVNRFGHEQHFDILLFENLKVR